MLDLVIIGGSVAGLTASIYAARRKMSFKLVSDALGGEMAAAGVVSNWPGIQEIPGFELAQKMIDHAKANGVEIDLGWKVEHLSKDGNHFNITARNTKGDEKKYESKAVIIATGIHPKKLNIPGEKEFDHKGVTYCTVCDGPLFRNKTTATIGTGNGALQGVLMMTKIAKKIYLFSKHADTRENNGGFPRADNILIDAVKASPNVEIIYGGTVEEIIGDKMVTGLKYCDAQGQDHTLDVQAIMVHIGNVPNSDFIDCVSKDIRGQITVDAKCQADCPGIFAAGDVTNSPFKQLTIAAGQGATAALAVIDYINKWKE